jgi:hypothetical protein
MKIRSLYISSYFQPIFTNTIEHFTIILCVETLLIIRILFYTIKAFLQFGKATIMSQSFVRKGKMLKGIRFLRDFNNSEVIEEYLYISLIFNVFLNFKNNEEEKPC